jgi:hypothetical protein
MIVLGGGLRTVFRRALSYPENDGIDATFK